MPASSLRTRTIRVGSVLSIVAAAMVWAIGRSELGHYTSAPSPQQRHQCLKSDVSKPRPESVSMAPTPPTRRNMLNSLQKVALGVGFLPLLSQRESSAYPLPQPPPPDELVQKRSELDSFFDTVIEMQQDLKQRESLKRLRRVLPEDIKARESELVDLRLKSEAEAKTALGNLQAKYEDTSKKTQGTKLCATPFGVDVVGITELVALTGALVGGVASRKRKEELVKVNDQLRKINFALRKQARIGGTRNPAVSSGMLFNPDLNYAQPSPPVTPRSEAQSAPADDAASPAPDDTRPPPDGSAFELSRDLTEPQRQCVIAMKEGKQLLKRNQVRSASVRFKKALMIATQLGDTDMERKASRGIGACYQRQFSYDEAIRYYLRAVELTEKRGDAIEYDMRDLYNSIADVYADMGDTDKALEYYDRYLRIIGSEGVQSPSASKDNNDDEGGASAPSATAAS
uniref:Uncharacterized protein n=1 Tax=Lotharella globosa TaxID=91324 RepID=A0A7S3Z3S2_9EUKA